MPLRTTLAVALSTLLASSFLEGTSAFSVNPAPAGSSSALYYVDDHTDTAVTERPATTTTAPTTAPIVHKKPTIYPISSLQELYDFLQEDDRLTAIK